MSSALGTLPGGVAFDPRDPSFAADPYPFYAALRRDDPVHHVPGLDEWWLTRYADAVAALTDPRLGRELPVMGPSSGHAAAAAPRDTRPMLWRDPPDHTRLRALVNRAFTPHVVEQLRPHIHDIATELLDQVQPAGQMDLVADFAGPLPAIVIAELLSVPTADREQFKTWSTAMALALDTSQPPAVHRAGGEAGAALGAYFAALLAQRRAHPQPDLISGLLAVEAEGTRLSPTELLSMCVLLLTAGHETTTNLIGSGTLSLLRHPEQLELLRRQPDLLPGAVEELLRFEPPIQRTRRLAKEPIQVEGVPIPAGAVVTVVLGAANRDPAVFPEPDRLDLTRRDNHHLAFGRGIHFCLGAPLARLEGQIAFDLLLRRFPHLALAAAPEWSGNTAMRSLRTLPLRF